MPYQIVLWRRKVTECYQKTMQGKCNENCPTLKRNACLLYNLVDGKMKPCSEPAKKGQPIPKIPSSRFLFENWNAGYCQKFYDIDINKEFIRRDIIGWCPASRVIRPRDDNEFIAIMLKDNTWCHLPTWAIKDECADNIEFWNFEGLFSK